MIVEVEGDGVPAIYISGEVLHGRAAKHAERGAIDCTAQCTVTAGVKVISGDKWKVRLRIQRVHRKSARSRRTRR